MAQSSAATILPARDFVRIGEAADVLGVSEQTLRNWDRDGKLTAFRHPINGYRLYRVSQSDALLREQSRSGPWQGELRLGLPTAQVDDELLGLPPCHWSSNVALDPKHRPQRWDAPSTTVRRDWRKYPQEAHVLSASGRRFRRLMPAEIAMLQGFDPRVVEATRLTVRQKIACMGDAVPPPVARAIFAAVDEVAPPVQRTALELCAGSGGLAEGAAEIGLHHELLVDYDKNCATVLRNDRHWSPERVVHDDVRNVDLSPFSGRIGVMSGGPPCQPWSNSGQRRGASDKRDLLGWLPSAVATVAPEAFVFENVAGLLSESNRAYLTDVIERLRNPSQDLRYGVLVARLNAADFGVPQVRNRVFLVGVRDAPASLVSMIFDEVHSRRSHAAPDQAKDEGLAYWRTVGSTIGELDDPGGWRRWIGL